MSKTRSKKGGDKPKAKANARSKRKAKPAGRPKSASKRKAPTGEERGVHAVKAWTEEAKREAVALLDRGDIPIGQLAEDLGVAERTLRIWQREYDAAEENTPMTPEERREMARLRRELERVTMERDILKKAATFFARHRS